MLEIKTGKVTDFPEPRTDSELPQTLYSSLAFSSDSTHLYAAFDSLSAPQGGGPNQTGNAIAVYSVSDGKLQPQQLLPGPLAATRRRQRHKTRLEPGWPLGMAIPYPAAIAIRKGAAGDELIVADNLSDDVLLMSAADGKVLRRFDLSHGNVVPSTYPIAVAVNRSGSRAFVALWNGSAIAELDLDKGKVLKTAGPAASKGAHVAQFAPGRLCLEPG